MLSFIMRSKTLQRVQVRLTGRKLSHLKREPFLKIGTTSEFLHSDGRVSLDRRNLKKKTRPSVRPRPPPLSTNDWGYHQAQAKSGQGDILESWPLHLPKYKKNHNVALFGELWKGALTFLHWKKTELKIVRSIM